MILGKCSRGVCDCCNHNEYNFETLIPFYRELRENNKGEINMSNRTYTYDALTTVKTVPELRAIARELGIPRMRKARREVIVNSILEAQNSVQEPAPQTSNVSSGVTPLTALDGEFTAVLNRPNGENGSRTTTTIRVSCGANADRFPVSGKSVGQVSELLREVLNVDRMAQGIVNGRPVEDDYVLQSGDTLEFLKPAGRKG